VHATFAVHALQEPLSQTSLVPHVVPFVRLLPVSLQTDTPVEHDVDPVWHGLTGVHAAFAVHALQEPLSQTALVPHVVPLARLVPVSLQTETPVEHDVVPVWQALAGVHETPAVHGAQEPLSQTALAPHTVPLVALVPVSVQTGEPPVQTIVPVWQEFVGVHAAPVVHVVQLPFWQT
jgi:hypothetical protein